MAGIATHFVPAVRLPSLLTRLSELETSDHSVVNLAIEEFAGIESHLIGMRSVCIYVIVE